MDILKRKRFSECFSNSKCLLSWHPKKWGWVPKNICSGNILNYLPQLFFCFLGENKHSGSGGQISWDQNLFFHEVEFMRLNFFSFFMRSKFLIINSISWLRQFSWCQNCLIILFRVLISWLFLWLTNRSWNQNSK